MTLACGIYREILCSVLWLVVTLTKTFRHLFTLRDNNFQIFFHNFAFFGQTECADQEYDNSL